MTNRQRRRGASERTAGSHCCWRHEAVNYPIYLIVRQLLCYGGRDDGRYAKGVVLWGVEGSNLGHNMILIGNGPTN